MRKKRLVSDTVYVLLQPWLVYFAFGSGRGSIPHQVRFVLMALTGLMMIVNLYFCEENCFQKVQKEEAKENGNAWRFACAECDFGCANDDWDTYQNLILKT